MGTIRDKVKKLNLENTNLKKWKIYLIDSIAVVILSYLFFTKVIIMGTIPSSSMEPTLEVGDIGITNGLAYVINEPQRGDIIIFNHEGDIYIKRVIGLPGDTVAFEDGYLYLNDGLVYEEYIDEDVETNGYLTYTVPEDCYFVLGDNREDSYDSRYWDNPYVPKNSIKGKLIFVISFNDIF